MYIKQTLSFIFLFSLLIAACTDVGKQHCLRQLEELERQNLCDSLMKDDSLAEALTDYFDHYGTPNECLRAHYILGRTYADLGEAPAALGAYQNAIECVDTTAQDCDWAKISRVYGQMSDVFYCQNLMEDYLLANSRSVSCAWRAKDTLQALRESTLRLVAFDRLGNADSVISGYDSLCNRFEKTPYRPVLSINSMVCIKSLLEKGQTAKAKQYLERYEAESGFFDSVHQIQKGKEIFYFYKGSYFLYTSQFDSAEYYYRKHLSEGRDVMSQNMASYGLANLFTLTARSDSAAKYALYSYAMNDSVYSMMATKEVETASKMYDYTRHQRKALIEHVKANREKMFKTYLAIALLAVLALFFVSLFIWQRHKSEMAMKYRKTIDELIFAQMELKHLHIQDLLYEGQIKEKQEIIDQYAEEIQQLHIEKKEEIEEQRDFKKVMVQKEEELAEMKVQKELLQKHITEANDLVIRLQKEMAQYNQKGAMEERNLFDSPVYQALVAKSNVAKELTSTEWMEIEEMIRELLPGFHDFIKAKRNMFSDYEYKICLLLRLHIRMKQTGGLIGIAKSQVSTISSQVMQKAFGEVGSGRELKKRLESIY